MRNRIPLRTLVLVALASAPLVAQAPPAPNPYKILMVGREAIKPGRGAAHDRLEDEWTKALADAKMPGTALALHAITGPRETWFVAPFASFADMSRLNRAAGANPALSAIEQRMDPQEAELLGDARSMMLVAREDLSYGTTPNLPQMRFFSITRVSVKPGHVAEFEDARKQVRQAHMTAHVADSYSVYQATAGAPAGTFFIFVPRKSMSDMDADSTVHGADYIAALGGEEGRRRMAAKAGDFMVSSQTDHYAFAPSQSIVSAEWAKQDPTFWKLRSTPPMP